MDYNKWDYQNDYHHQDRLERNLETESENLDEFDWSIFISDEFDFLYDLLEFYKKYDIRFKYIRLHDLSKTAPFIIKTSNFQCRNIINYQ